MAIENTDGEQLSDDWHASLPLGWGDPYGDPGPRAEWAPSILAHMSAAGIEPQAADAREQLEAHFAQQNEQISIIANVAKVRAAAALRKTPELLTAVQDWWGQTSEQRLAIIEQFSTAICQEWGFSGVSVDDAALGYTSLAQGQVYAGGENSDSLAVAINPRYTRTTDEIVTREVAAEQEALAAEDGREGIQLGPGMQPFEMIAPERRAQEMRPGIEAYGVAYREALTKQFGDDQAEDGQMVLHIVGHEVGGHVAQALLPLVADYAPADLRHRYDSAIEVLNWERYIASQDDHGLYQAQPLEAMAENIAGFVVKQAARLMQERNQASNMGSSDTQSAGSTAPDS